MNKYVNFEVRIGSRVHSPLLKNPGTVIEIGFSHGREFYRVKWDHLETPMWCAADEFIVD